MAKKPIKKEIWIDGQWVAKIVDYEFGWPGDVISLDWTSDVIGVPSPPPKKTHSIPLKQISLNDFFVQLGLAQDEEPEPSCFMTVIV